MAVDAYRNKYQRYNNTANGRARGVRYRHSAKGRATDARRKRRLKMWLRPHIKEYHKWGELSRRRLQRIREAKI